MTTISDILVLSLFIAIITTTTLNWKSKDGPLCSGCQRFKFSGPWCFPPAVWLMDETLHDPEYAVVPQFLGFWYVGSYRICPTNSITECYWHSPTTLQESKLECIQFLVWSDTARRRCGLSVRALNHTKPHKREIKSKTVPQHYTYSNMLQHDSPSTGFRAPRPRRTECDPGIKLGNSLIVGIMTVLITC